MTRVIDAHHHFWRTAAQDQPWRTSAHAGLERDFEADDLRPRLAAAGVDGTVLMQSVDEPAENDRLAEYAADPMVAGVVAWLPLADAERAREVLDGLTIPRLCGVRCLVARDPMAWLTTPSSLDLFETIASRQLAWDVVPITQEQTEAVLRLAEQVPSLRIVVDHLGRPPLESQGWEPWAGLMQQLAGCPNVAVKISVGIDALTAWSAWDPTALTRYVDAVVDWFGPDRAMVASNWPVVLLRADYERAWDDLSRLAAARLTDEASRAALLGGTATAWYGLPEADTRIPDRDDMASPNSRTPG
jgi:L-fuconolactonase